MTDHFLSAVDWHNDGLGSAEWRMRLGEMETNLQRAERVVQDRHQDVARCKALLAHSNANTARVGCSCGADGCTDSQ